MTPSYDDFVHAGMSECGVLARTQDYERYLCALYAPDAEIREQLFTLIAFYHEIAKTGDYVSQEMLGMIRLAWWREAVEELYAGGAVRAHGVVQALDRLLRARPLAKEALLAMIAAYQELLAIESFATLESLERHGEATAAALLDLMAQCCGINAETSLEVAKHLGIAYALVGCVRAIGQDPVKGERFLPDDLVLRHGVQGDDVLHRRATPALTAAVSAMLDRAAWHLQQVPQQQAAPVAMAAVVVGHYLRRLQRTGGNPFALRRESGRVTLQIKMMLASLRARF